MTNFQTRCRARRGNGVRRLKLADLEPRQFDRRLRPLGLERLARCKSL